jgi:zinc and cadmium transporter
VPRLPTLAPGYPVRDHGGFSDPGESAAMHPTLAAITLGSVAFASLVVYLLLIAAAAFAGGSSIAFLSLGHRRMQVLLSLTGGIMLGVGLLHLLPHAYVELSRQIDLTMAWVLAGFFLMFLLERAFHGHAHHSADGSHGAHGHSGDHHHDHDHHGHGVHQPHAAPRSGPWAWCGAFAGLALHSLADGAALAASIDADASHGVGLLAGFATFLAVLLHKPFDSGIIATLMINAGVSPAWRRIVNAAYAAIVPLGAMLFLGSLQLYGGSRGPVVGAALALAAGAFLCIAAADLLPEVEFHSHDRLLLTAALTLGITIAWGITVMERSSHAHAVHGSGSPAASHAHGQ